MFESGHLTLLSGTGEGEVVSKEVGEEERGREEEEEEEKELSLFTADGVNEDKRVPIFDRGTGPKHERFRSGFSGWLSHSYSGTSLMLTLADTSVET